MFIHIPFTDIPSLITQTIPHTLVPFICLYAVTDFTQSGRLINRNCVTKPACSLSLRPACSLTGNSNALITDYALPRNLPFLWLPSERSIDGLDFHQLIYVHFMAYRMTRKITKKTLDTNFTQSRRVGKGEFHSQASHRTVRDSLPSYGSCYS